MQFWNVRITPRHPGRNNTRDLKVQELAHWNTVHPIENKQASVTVSQMLCSAKIRGIMVEYLLLIGIYVQSRAVPALHRHHLRKFLTRSFLMASIIAVSSEPFAKLAVRERYAPMVLIQMRVPKLNVVVSCSSTTGKACLISICT